MKQLVFLITLLSSTFISAQSVMEITYLDVHPTQIGEFVKLHKKVTDMSQSEERTIKGQWVYRHWYGSGASIAIYDQYDSAEDAVKDDLTAAFQKNYEELSEEAQKEMDEIFSQWWSFFDGHWDEMRFIDYEKFFVSKENVDWDIPFVFVVGNYNTSGSILEMANAYMDWQTRVLVKDGLQLGGGASVHYKGSGTDVQFFGGFKDIMDFAKSINTPLENPNVEARDKFWKSVSGTHEDQIYVHVGHLEKGVFNLAGKDK